MIDVKVPSPGESITEVTIDSWLKNDGDAVAQDEALADIQSDKATLTIYAEAAGKLKILAKAGDTVKVGAVVCQIDETAAGGAAKPATPAADKAAAVTAPASSTAADQPSSKAATPEPNKGKEEQADEKPDSYAKNLPSPAAQKMLEDQARTPDSVQGTGRDGRITKADVIEQPAAPAKAESAKEAIPAPATKPAQPATKAVPISAMSGERKNHHTKMTVLRKTLAGRLVAAKNETAMLTTFNEVDMTAILELRKKYKDRFKELHDINLGFMSFFCKACAEAMNSFPQVNGQLAGEDIVTFDYVDIGVAVSTDRGLMVPVVRNVESKTMAELEKEVANVAERARTSKITIDEMTGGTFTITNGGVFGSLMSTPILNPPQSAILGMHKIQERPVVLNGVVVVRPMMYLALSYDHRVIDGRESVSYLVRVKDLLEDPMRLLLQV